MPPEATITRVYDPNKPERAMEVTRVLDQAPGDRWYQTREDGFLPDSQVRVVDRSWMIRFEDPFERKVAP